MGTDKTGAAGDYDWFPLHESTMERNRPEKKLMKAGIRGNSAAISRVRFLQKINRPKITKNRMW